MKPYYEMLCNAYEGVNAESAKKIVETITKKTIRKLQRLKRDSNMMQSPEDSELDNVWDEYCVQILGEESIFFDLYNDYIYDIIYDLIMDCCTENDKKIIWLQTEEFQNWSKCERDVDDLAEEKREENFYSPFKFFDAKGFPSEYEIGAVVRYIADVVGEQAGNYCNKRIDKYLFDY